MSKVSALIVVHNEATILEDCLAQLTFADEIVVVLDRCTDGSKAIADKFNARLVEGAWPLEADRRHAGIDACAGPWVFEIDADEWVPDALAAEITASVAADDADFYFQPIHNHVGTRWVRYGWMAALAPDAKGNLFRKGCKTWGAEPVHPNVTFSGRRGADHQTGIRHNFVADISGLMTRFNRNTSLAAIDLHQRGVHVPTRTLARKSVSRFWKCFVARKGYREGSVGLVVATLCALYPLVAHLKAAEIKS